MARRGSGTRRTGAEAPAPRAKTRGDEAYNTRRRLKRRAARERKKGNIATAVKLEAAAAATYAKPLKGQGGRRTLDAVQEQLAAARQTLKDYLRGANRAQTFQERLRQRIKEVDEWNRREREAQGTPRTQAGLPTAEAGEPERWQAGEVPASLTKEERALLFASTRDVWAGLPRAAREEHLLKTYRVESLEQLYAQTLGAMEREAYEYERLTLEGEEKYKYLMGKQALAIK